MNEVAIVKRKTVGNIIVSPFFIYVLQIAKMLDYLDEIKLREELKKQAQRIDEEIMGLR